MHQSPFPLNTYPYNPPTQTLNEMFEADLEKLVVFSEPKVDELTFISIDASGADIRVRAGSEFSVERITFGSKVHNKKEAIEAVRMIIAGRKSAGRW